VTAGAVTAVLNQGMCGGPWSFVTTGSIEGITFIKTGKLVPLSNEQLLECANPGQGCSGGGTPDQGFQFVIGAW
jgi:hypothetical protein